MAKFKFHTLRIVKPHDYWVAHFKPKSKCYINIPIYNMCTREILTFCHMVKTVIRTLGNQQS